MENGSWEMRNGKCEIAGEPRETANGKWESVGDGPSGTGGSHRLADAHKRQE